MRFLKKLLLGICLSLPLFGAVPTVTINGQTGTTVKEPVTFTFAWSEAVSGFVADDITVSGGTKGTFSGSGNSYTLVVTPSANTQSGTISVSVGANAATSTSTTQQNTVGDSATQDYDTQKPTVSSVISSDTTLKKGETATITFTFSEAVQNFDNSDLVIQNGTLTNVSSGDGNITWTATFTPTDTLEDTTNTITVNISDITDSVGNPLGLAKISDNYTIDTKLPTISSIAIVSATGIQNGFLNAGDVVSVRVTMSENTIVTGTPQLALNIGGTTVQANYTSGSGTTQLLFTYTIAATQTDADGISIDANSLAINGGTISDSAGNGATITHTAVGNNGNYKVDTTSPTQLTVALTNDMGASSSDAITYSDILTIGDQEGSATIEYSTNNGTTWTTTRPTTDGTYSLLVRQIDLAGNISPSSTPLGYTLDKTLPTVTITSTTSGYNDNSGEYETDDYINKNESNATLIIVGATTGLATGANVHINYSGTDYNVTTDGSGNFSTIIPANDMIGHSMDTYSDTLVINVVDIAGNDANQATKIFTIDLNSSVDMSTTAGTLSKSALTNGFIVSGITDLEDGQTIAISLNGIEGTTTTPNGSSYGMGSYSITLPSQTVTTSFIDGTTYPITFTNTPKDKAGNIATLTTKSVIYDEISDIQNEATSIETNTTTPNATLYSSSDIDWFKVSVPSRGLLQVDTNDTNIKVGIFYSDGSTVADNSDSNISKVVGTGEYYIKVSGDAGSYRLSNRFTPFAKEIDSLASVRFDTNTTAINRSGIVNNTMHNGYTYSIANNYMKLTNGTNIYTLDRYKADYFFINGNRLYTVSSVSGMVVYDITNEASISIVGIKSSANNNISGIDDRYIYDGTIGALDIRQDLQETMPTDPMTLPILPLNLTVSMNNWAGEIDTDIFKVVLKKSGTLKFMKSNEKSGNELNITVSKNSDFSSNDITSFGVDTNLSAGTYYVKIVGNANTVDGKYDLNATFTTSDMKIDKVQNYIKSTNDVTLTQASQPITGTLITAGDVDLYKITLNEKGIIELNSSTHTVSLLKVTPNTTSDFATETNQSLGHLDSGVYYIKVSGSATNYTVSAKFTPDTPDGNASSTTTYSEISSNQGWNDLSLDSGSGLVSYVEISYDTNVSIYNPSTKQTIAIELPIPYSYSIKRATLQEQNLTVEYLNKSDNQNYSIVLDISHSLANPKMISNAQISTLTSQTTNTTSLTIGSHTFAIDPSQGVKVTDSVGNIVKRITNIQKPTSLFHFGDRLYIIDATIEKKIVIIDTKKDYSDYPLESSLIYQGTSINGSLTSGDTDYFTITHNGTGDLNISGLASDVNCSVRDNNNSVSSCNVANLTAGTYYLKLSSTATKNYSFQVTQSYDDHLDTMNFDTNKSHALIGKDTTSSGNMSTTTDKDYFKIIVDEKSELTLTPSNGVIGELYYNGGDKLTPQNGIYTLPKGGVYFISIESNGTFTGGYTLSYRLSTGLLNSFIDNADTQNKYLSTLETNGNIIAMKLYGENLFVADSVDGLIVFDVTTASNPIIKSKIQTNGTPKGITIEGTFAYVAQGESGIEIFDISNPSAIRLIGGYNTNGTAYEIELNTTAKELFVADGENGIVKLSIANPSLITDLATFGETTKDARSIKLVDGKVVVADYTNGLMVYDTNGVKNTTLSKTGTGYSKVLTANNTIYTANDKTLSIYDSSFTRKDLYTISTEITNIALVDDLIYIMNATGVQVVNVKNPADIVAVRDFSTIRNDDNEEVGEVPLLSLDSSQENLFYGQAGKLHILELSPDYADTFVGAEQFLSYPSTIRGQVLSSRATDKDIFKLTTKYSGYLSIKSVDSSMGVDGKLSFYTTSSTGMGTALAQTNYTAIKWDTLTPKIANSSTTTNGFELTNITVNQGDFYVVLEDSRENKIGGNYEFIVDFNRTDDKFPDVIEAGLENYITTQGGVVSDSLFGDGGDVDFIDINVSGRQIVTFNLSGAVKPRVTIFYKDGTQANISTNKDATSYTTELSSGEYKVRFDGYEDNASGIYTVALSSTPIGDIMVENGFNESDITGINDVAYLGTNIYAITKNTVTRYNHLLEQFTTTQTDFRTNFIDANDSKNHKIFTYQGDGENEIISYIVTTSLDGLKPIVSSVTLNTLEKSSVNMETIAGIDSILPYLSVEHISKNEILYMYDGSTIQIRALRDSNNGNMVAYPLSGEFAAMSVVDMGGSERAYIATKTGSLEILDVTYGNPVTYTAKHTSSNTYGQVGALFVDTKINRLYLGTDKKIKIYDLLNITAPKFLNEFDFTGKEYEATPSSIYVKDKRLYAVLPAKGIVVGDIAEDGTISIYEDILHLGKNINDVMSADGRTLNYTVKDDANVTRLKIYFFEESFSDGESDSVYTGMEDGKEPKEGCFIATAAFGSYFEKHVQVLRAFRDNVLMTTALGRAFVEFYYEYSPSIAAVIANNEPLKMVVRGVLTPIVYMIEYPLWFVLGIVLVVFGRRKLRKGVNI